MSAMQEAETEPGYAPTALDLLSPVHIGPIDRPRLAGRVPLRRLIIPKAVSAIADASFLLLAMGLAYNVGRPTRSRATSNDPARPASDPAEMIAYTRSMGAMLVVESAYRP